MNNEDIMIDFEDDTRAEKGSISARRRSVIAWHAARWMADEAMQASTRPWALWRAVPRLAWRSFALMCLAAWSWVTRR